MNGIVLKLTYLHIHSTYSYIIQFSIYKLNDQSIIYILENSNLKQSKFKIPFHFFKFKNTQKFFSGFGGLRVPV